MPSISFSPTSLEWIGYYDPKLSSTMSTAHWAPEPGTNNMLNYHIKVKLASQPLHKESEVSIILIVVNCMLLGCLV